MTDVDYTKFTVAIDDGSFTPLGVDGTLTTKVDPDIDYTVSEYPVGGYSTEYSNCQPIRVASKQTATCTITNIEDEGALTYVCGDGGVGPGEVCDDGGLNGEPGYCSADCMTPGAYNYCGNGIQEEQYNEQCDDGNITNGDGCSALCRTEVVGCTDPEAENYNVEAQYSDKSCRYRSDDVCPNLDGIQTEIPPGYRIDGDGECRRGSRSGQGTLRMPTATPMPKPEPTPEVLGATTLPETGFGLFDAFLMIGFTACLLTGALLMMIGLWRRRHAMISA